MAANCLFPARPAQPAYITDTGSNFAVGERSVACKERPLGGAALPFNDERSVRAQSTAVTAKPTKTRRSCRPSGATGRKQYVYNIYQMSVLAKLLAEKHRRDTVRIVLHLAIIRETRVYGDHPYVGTTRKSSFL